MQKKKSQPKIAKVAGEPSLSAKPPARKTVTRSFCVYCGSGLGTDPAYAEAARTLGRSLAENGVGLVYGGGSLGLMGEVARATLAHGGRVTGIIPTFLSEREQMLRDVDEMILVEDMHQRKRLMFERSDAFIALPGGIGTLDERAVEHAGTTLVYATQTSVVADKSVYWGPCLDLLAHMKKDSFIRAGLEVRFHVVATAEEIVPTALGANGHATGPGANAAVTTKF